MGTTPWSNDEPRDLIVPPGAGPDDPRVVIGPDIPPELLAKYPGMTAAILLYIDGMQYMYWGVGGPNGYVQGTVYIDPPNTLVVERDITEYTASLWSLIGDPTMTNEIAIGSLTAGGVTKKFTIHGDVITNFLAGATTGDVQIDGRSIFRGVIANAYDTADSASVTAETTILFEFQVGGASLLPGRVYRFAFGNRVKGSAASLPARFRGYYGITTAGPFVDFGAFTTSATVGTSTNAGGEAYFVVTAAVARPASFSLSLQNLAGGANTVAQAANAANLRWFNVQDAGDVTDWGQPLPPFVPIP